MIVGKPFTHEHRDAVIEAARMIREGIAFSRLYPPDGTGAADNLAVASRAACAVCDHLDEIAAMLVLEARAPSAPVKAAECAPNSADDGFDRPPARYSKQVRETIDRQRDMSWSFAQRFIDGLSRDNIRGLEERDVNDLADLMFGYLCRAQAQRYRDRLGLKGGDEGRDHDQTAIRFYSEMASHVLTGGPDPRCGRPNFRPYERWPWTDAATLVPPENTARKQEE